jgi:glycopeptide antibiotics resistance protein
VYVSDVPWFAPGVVVSILVGFLVSSRLGAAMGIRRTLAMALVVGLGIILSATLTPSPEALEIGATGTMTCDFTRMGRASLAELLRIDDTSLNVLLFVPLGTVVGLLPRSRRKAAIAVAAVALPFAVEAVQLLVVALDRACQSADVFDNLTGLLLGVAVGGFVGWLAPTLAAPGGTGPRAQP